MISLKNKHVFAKPIMLLILKVFMLLLLSVGIACLVQENWVRNLNLYHTILELTCVFIALAIFFSVWYTYEKSHDYSYIFGFGFLVVAIFDALHAYYHLKLDLTALTYFDLSTRFWILARLSEAITVFLAVTSLRFFSSKYINVFMSLGVALGVAYFVVAKHDLLPALLTKDGVTPIKVFLEYAVIAINIISLICIRKKLFVKGKITYSYIFISIIMSIGAEFCFTIYSTISNTTWTIGHLMKIISYFYLFKGCFISTVLFPYDELVAKNSKLEYVNSELNSLSATMKDLLDALPIGIQKFDHTGKLDYTNKKLEELLQCSKEDIEALSDTEEVRLFLSTEKNDSIIDFSLLTDECDASVSVLSHLSKKNIKLSVSTQSISSGTLVMLCDTKKEQELENLSIQTETILNSISNGVIMIDASKNIILANKPLYNIYEAAANQLIGMNIDDLNDITNFSETGLADKALKDKSEGHIHDVSIKSFKGNMKELSLYASPIKNINGEIIGAIGIVTDITEYKLEQKRIIQQEKLALLGQMGAGIVHETRNFLTTIKGRCQLISMLSNDDRIMLHASKINDDVEEVNRIISEFLFLSKPKETELVESSINEVFESIKSMLETSSLVRGVNLDIKPCKEERYIRCDESQLKQVILNICKNGIDAMSEVPNAKLSIDTVFDDTVNELRIRIADNGKGIPKEHLDKIGTPFFTTKNSGTGLGLSVCFKIIKDHGGRIEVESQLGKGTAFVIILPCISDEELEEYVC